MISDRRSCGVCSRKREGDTGDTRLSGVLNAIAVGIDPDKVTNGDWLHEAKVYRAVIVAAIRTGLASEGERHDAGDYSVSRDSVTVVITIDVGI